jgi:hypothetical protein
VSARCRGASRGECASNRGAWPRRESRPTPLRRCPRLSGRDDIYRYDRKQPPGIACPPPPSPRSVSRPCIRLGSWDSSLLRSEEGDPLFNKEGRNDTTLTLRCFQHVVATNGNGSRLIWRFSRRGDLRPVTTGCNHGPPLRLHLLLPEGATPRRQECPTIATVFSGASFGGDGAEAAGAEHFAGRQQPRDLYFSPAWRSMAGSAQRASKAGCRTGRPSSARIEDDLNPQTSG